MRYDKNLDYLGFGDDFFFKSDSKDMLLKRKILSWCLLKL